MKDIVGLLADKTTWPQAYAQLEKAGQDALPSILDGLRDADWRIRKRCLLLLDHLATEQCSAAIVGALADISAEVRRLAVHAIGCQACKPHALNLDVAGLLIERARLDSSIRVRRVAIHMLGNQRSDTRAIHCLEQIGAEDPDPGSQSRAQWALGRQIAGASIASTALSTCVDI